MPLNVKALLENAEINETIIIPPGTYVVSKARITVPLTLIGEGRVVFQGLTGNSDTGVSYRGGAGVTEPMARFHVENINFENYDGIALGWAPGFLTGGGDTERISIHNCSFENCDTCIHGDYNTDPDLFGDIDYIDMRDIEMRNVDRGILMLSTFRYCALTNSSVTNATNQAVFLGNTTARSPDPDSEFENILVDGCIIENVTNATVMQALLMFGHSVKVTNTHFKDNVAFPGPVGHTSHYASVYTKASKVIATGNTFLDAAGLILKGAPNLVDPDNTTEAIVTGNIFDSHLVPVDGNGVVDPAKTWGVQALSSTTPGSVIFTNNMVLGMEVILPTFTNRSIIANNIFFRTPLTGHFAKIGREAIFHESASRDKHDIRDNIFDSTQLVDTGVYWHPSLDSGMPGFPGTP